MFKYSKIALTFTTVVLLFTKASFADETFSVNSNVQFEAQNISFDINNNLVVATGNVRFTSEDYTITADKVSYNTENENITAVDNIVIIDSEGNIAHADYASFNYATQQLLASHFKAIVDEYNPLYAELAYKNSENKYTLEDICYNLCEESDEEHQTTSIRASSALFNHSENSLLLKNVRVKIYGVPVLWFPSLYSSNLQFERRAGFLIPDLINHGHFGFGLKTPFYVPIGETQSIYFNTYFFNGLHNAIPLDIRYSGFIPKGDFSLITGGSFKENDTIPYLNDDQWYVFNRINLNPTKNYKASIVYEDTSSITYLNSLKLNPKNTSNSFLLKSFYNEFSLREKSFLSVSAQEYNTENKNFITGSEFNKKLDVSFMNVSSSPLLGSAKLNIDSTYFFNRESNKNQFYRIAGGLNYENSIKTKLGVGTVNSFVQNANYFYNTNVKTGTPLDESQGFFYRGVGVGLSWEVPFYTVIQENSLYIAPKAQVAFSEENTNSSVAEREYFMTDSFSPNITSHNFFRINHYSGYDKVDNIKNLKYGVSVQYIGSNNSQHDFFAGKYMDYSTEESRANSDYFIMAQSQVTANLSFAYDAILQNDFSQIIEDKLSSRYTNDFMSAYIQYSRYNNLNLDIHKYSSISELVTGYNFHVSNHIRTGQSITFASENKEDLMLTKFRYYVAWQDTDINVQVYINKELYENNKDNITYGIIMNILGIKL